jgi:predicted RNase H-like nuclease (RuvC/YqgF family)
LSKRELRQVISGTGREEVCEPVALTDKEIEALMEHYVELSEKCHEQERLLAGLEQKIAQTIRRLHGECSEEQAQRAFESLQEKVKDEKEAALRKRFIFLAMTMKNWIESGEFSEK